MHMLTAAVVHDNVSPVGAHLGYSGQTSWIQPRKDVRDELYRELVHKTRRTKEAIVLVYMVRAHAQSMLLWIHFWQAVQLLLSFSELRCIMMGCVCVAVVVVFALVYKFVFCICCIMVVLSKRHELSGGCRKRAGLNVDVIEADCTVGCLSFLW